MAGSVVWVQVKQWMQRRAVPAPQLQGAAASAAAPVRMSYASAAAMGNERGAETGRRVVAAGLAVIGDAAGLVVIDGPAATPAESPLAAAGRHPRAYGALCCGRARGPVRWVWPRRLLPSFPASSPSASSNPASAASASSFPLPEDFDGNRRTIKIFCKLGGLEWWIHKKKLTIDEPVIKYWAALTSSPDAFLEPEN